MKKKRVAHIITRMIIGGAQENTLYTVIGLSHDPAYDVTLITGPTYGPEGSLLPEANNAGVRIITVPTLRRNLNPVYDAIAFFHLWVLMIRGRYDIVHTHSSKAGIIGRIAAYCAGCTTIIHTIHGMPFHAYETAVRNFVYKVCERCAGLVTDTIITVCDEMTRQACAAHIAPKEKFVTVYSGLDIASFDPLPQPDITRVRSSFGVPDSAFVIGKISRLFDLKGHAYLLDAAVDVIKACPDVYFLFVGGGALEDELRKKAQFLGIQSHIIFAGLVPTQDIPLYLQTMDMVVHVSLREGLPRVVPQAFLSGCAVVAFDVDGARDIIEDGVNGFLIEPKNSVMLAEKVVQLVQNTALREVFGKRGRERVLRFFAKEKMVEDIKKVYEMCRSLRS